MFQEIWLETCSVCFEDTEKYFKNECMCTALVCESCFKLIDKCPFCRQQYSSYVSPFITTFTPISGVFPPSNLNRQDAQTAKRNWNFWFQRFEGKNIMRPHLFRGLIFNHDIIHQQLRTGRFERLNEAGVCLNKREAFRFVKRQLEEFINSV